MSSNKQLMRQALLDVGGSAGLSFTVIFLAFGTYLRSAGLDIFQSLAMNIMYAMPGQIIALNAIVSELSVGVCVMLVFIINLRLLPMSLTIAKLCGTNKISKPTFYFAAYFVAVTGWLNFMRNYQNLAAEDNFNYFIYSSIIIWLYGILGFFLGYYFIGYLSYNLFVALLLVNPLYFLAVVALHGRDDLLLGIAVLGGCLLYLPCELLFGNLALLLAGIGGGTLAYLLHIYRGRHNRQPELADPLVLTESSEQTKPS